MTHIKFYSVCSALIVLFLSSCKESDYRVNSAFADYLQRFEDEGATRGHTFDFKSSGLVIEFGNLDNDVAGLTHYENPIRIQIDKTYWDDISKTAGADMMKEDLIFHELGHGVLGRKHLNTTLENGDWKSIMCGGDKVNNRSWNINYRGERRKYYLDELFDESTVAPDFSSFDLIADTTGYTPVLQRNFSTADQAIWKLMDTVTYKTSLDNGRLCFQSKVDQVYFVYATLSTAINIQSDFSYEMTFQYPTGNATNQYGLIFGTSGNEATEYFSIDNNQNMYMGNRSWYSFFTQLAESSINPTNINKLKVFKIGSFLYYFINNVYCYQSEIVANTNLNQFGFMVPPQSSVWIDNLQISQKTSSKVSSMLKQNIQIESGLKTVPAFNQKSVNQ